MSEAQSALEHKLKEASLKIYVINTQSMFASFSLEQVQTQFQLSKAETLKQVSKLIISGTIQAQIDSSTNSVIFETKNSVIGVDNRKGMEFLQTQHLDKIKQMVESNERCMELLVNQNAYIQHNSKDKAAEKQKAK